jgi:putative phosphoribosyl transferase
MSRTSPAGQVAMRRFRDREEAGRELAAALRSYREQHPIVLALPRGGVPVGYEIARALSAPLDVWIVRKVGVPWHPELGLGAVAEGGHVHITPEVLRHAGLSDAELSEAIERKRREVEERVSKFRGSHPPPALRGRTVILVDDGIATGGTVRAAIHSIRAQQPASLVLAVPVASPDTVRALAKEVDEVVCLMMPEDLYAIGLWYENFDQVSDEEVKELLERARRTPRRDASSEPSLAIPAGRAELQGDLHLPAGARGLVLFAHGSGSGRKSPRNRFVAQALRSRGLGTLLFDLLTEEEEEQDAIDGHLRFDIPLLARRLGAVTDWIRGQRSVSDLSVGYFGASTGAAAALMAAAERPRDIRAVVSRGGRPDLAEDALERVRAPTLLIVGGADGPVIELNRAAMARMSAPKKLVIVPGATHLFEEPGALEEVARLAGDFFVAHLGRSTGAHAPAPR